MRDARDARDPDFARLGTPAPGSGWAAAWLIVVTTTSHHRTGRMQCPPELDIITRVLNVRGVAS
jgi:hypothetical protein